MYKLNKNTLQRFQQQIRGKKRKRKRTKRCMLKRQKFFVV